MEHIFVLFLFFFNFIMICIEGAAQTNGSIITVWVVRVVLRFCVGRQHNRKFFEKFLFINSFD